MTSIREKDLFVEMAVELACLAANVSQLDEISFISDEDARRIEKVKDSVSECLARYNEVFSQVNGLRTNAIGLADIVRRHGQCSLGGTCGITSWTLDVVERAEHLGKRDASIPIFEVVK